MRSPLRMELTTSEFNLICPFAATSAPFSISGYTAANSLAFSAEIINPFATSDWIEASVSIADVYDAMTAARVYRGALCPFKVIEMFESEGLSMFDPEYILVFMENIVQTYIKNWVRLSDGRVGEIIMLNQNKLSRPIVMCDGAFVNLLDYPNLSIEEVLI